MEVDPSLSDGEEMTNYAELNAAQNRKHKKAGGWQALGLDHSVFKGIQKMGYKQPTPIQRKAIPTILDGKDVVAMSRTGSGKTAAFVVPMIQKLKQRDPQGIRALLLSPTRELAMQTFKFIKMLAKFTGLRCACLVGGENLDEQFSAVHERPDILIATPGRLLHVSVEMNLRLSHIQYIVFDEADRLFEMGFAEQLHDILKRLPDNRQTLLFSATLPKMIVDFAKAGLTDPVLVRLDVDTKISDKLSMLFFTCRDNDKLSALLYLARTAIQNNEQTIVFCATMKHVEYVVAILNEAGLDCCFLYSQLDPMARKMNISRFREKRSMLLIVTDVAARGVDIPLLDNAINFHFPPKPKLFIHRVGRVARAGMAGRSFSLISQDELPYVADLFLFLGRPMKFADKNSIFKEDEVLIGSFPDQLVHLDIEFLRNVYENSLEISDLQNKSENAMKKYLRTRPPPAAESVRRSKTEFSQISPSPHPFLRESNDESAIAELALLEGIRNYRPSATIFEFKSNNKQEAANVMKTKRKDHERYLKNKEKREKETSGEFVSQNLDTSQNTSLVSNGDENALDDDEVLKSFSHVVTVAKFNPSKMDKERPQKNSRKRNLDEIKEREKREHYVSYVPKDNDTEKALAIDRPSTFDEMAKKFSVEITADDDVGLYKETKRKKWDRKLKKFVGEPESRVKRIRTEEGTWLPATYKSGRYEKWQEKQKISYKRDDEDGGEESNRFNGPKFGKNQRFRGKNNSMKEKPGRGELKAPEQILKARNQKAKKQAYQGYRKKENLKKRIGGGGSKKGHGGGGDKGRFKKPSFRGKNRK